MCDLLQITGIKRRAFFTKHGIIGNFPAAAGIAARKLLNNSGLIFDFLCRNIFKFCNSCKRLINRIVDRSARLIPSDRKCFKLEIQRAVRQTSKRTAKEFIKRTCIDDYPIKWRAFKPDTNDWLWGKIGPQPFIALAIILV